jgi:hypothetical protein
LIGIALEKHMPRWNLETARSLRGRLGKTPRWYRAAGIHFFISHVNIDDGFTEDLSSNKRQTEAGHVLSLADYAEDARQSSPYFKEINYRKRMVS